MMKDSPTPSHPPAASKETRLWCGLRQQQHGFFLLLVLNVLLLALVFWYRSYSPQLARVILVPMNSGIEMKNNDGIVVKMSQEELDSLVRKSQPSGYNSSLLITTQPPNIPEPDSSAVNGKADSEVVNATESPWRVDNPLAATVDDSEINPELKKAFAFMAVPASHQNASAAKKSCSELAPQLIGTIKVFHESYPIAQLNSLNFHVAAGGSYIPPDCQPTQNLAIVIPFRCQYQMTSHPLSWIFGAANREEHLSVLLLNLHPFLQKQRLSYTIFIVNQEPGSKFNRALLMNIGFLEAMQVEKFDCIIFHDVDLLPENDKNLYTCPEKDVRHMSAYIDKFNYKIPYARILGGIAAIRSDLFIKVNGYSNKYFGWGGEDDDFSTRCRSHGLEIVRYPQTIARYQMIKHKLDAGNEKNPQRQQLLKHTADREGTDGLNSIVYKLDSIDYLPLYTRVNVIVNQADVMNSEARKTLPSYLLS